MTILTRCGPTVAFGLATSIAVLGLACAGPQTPVVTGAAGGAGAAERVSAPAADAPSNRVSGSVSQGEPAREELLAWVVADSFDALLARATGYVANHLPFPLQAQAQPQQLKQQLFAVLAHKMPGLEQALDTNRPFAVAVGDTERYTGGRMGPLVCAIPVKDGDAFVDALAASVPDRARTPAGNHRLGTHKPLFVRVGSGYAIIGGHEALLAGAQATLLEAVARPLKDGAKLTVELAKIYARHHDKLEAAFGALSRTSSSATLNRLLDNLKSTERITADLQLQPTELAVTAKARPRAQGALREYLGKLNVGKPWGGEYLPADAALAILSRQNPDRSQERMDEFKATLLRLLDGVKGADKARQIPERWTAAITAAYHELTGEQSAAVWSTPDGGIGFGGAWHATDATRSRETMRKLLRTIGKDVNTLIGLAVRHSKLKGLDVKLELLADRFRGAGVKGDLVRLRVRWPRVTKALAASLDTTVAEARAQIKQAKRVMATLVGKDLTLAIVTLDAKNGETIGLMAGGKDYAPRIKQMIEIAQGRRPPSTLAKRIEQYVGGTPIVSFVYAPVASLIEQTLRVVERVTSVPPKMRTLIQQSLPAPGHDVPAAAWVTADAAGLGVELHLSSELVGMTAKMVFFALMPTSPP